MSKRKGGYDVGYGKPPAHTQFRAGQSGNPSGRPRKKKDPELPPLDLTRTYIQREGRRMITIREGGKAKSIPVIEAIMHAMSIKAMQGSILAQRTVLDHQLKEDARVRAEREQRFKFWQDYVRDTKALFAKAAARGDPPPELYPHPSDVQLNYRSLEVDLVGPMNEAEARQCQRRLESSAYLYELMLYTREATLGLPSADNPRCGMFTLLFLIEIQFLPPRLRLPSDEAREAIEKRMMGRHSFWIEYLNSRGRELGYPMDAKRIKARHLDLRDLNLRFIDGKFVDYRWPKPRKLAGMEGVAAGQWAARATQGAED